MFRKVLLVFFVLIFTFSLAACGGAPDGGNAPVVSTAETKAVPPVSGTPGPTGEPGDTAKPGENAGAEGAFVFPAEGVRPYAVMIDNEGARSLPQGGLDRAQVIYEVIVEGGETRLMPVFWGTAPEMIGPVRSSRHYFLDYALEHDAIYVHFGYSPMAMQDIPKLGINNINGVANGGEIFYDLTKDRNNWQDSYTSAKNIGDYIKKVGYRTATDKKPVFTYNKADIVPVDGQKAEKIEMAYSSAYTSGFTYDASMKRYKRLRKGKPQVERATGKQLEAKNIIIQNVESHTIKGDTAGRQELADVGSGSGWFITCGKAVKLHWSKQSRSAPTKYTDEAGNAILLNPGQTWVQVVPANGKVVLE